MKLHFLSHDFFFLILKPIAPKNLLLENLSYYRKFYAIKKNQKKKSYFRKFNITLEYVSKYNCNLSSKK